MLNTSMTDPRTEINWQVTFQFINFDTRMNVKLHSDPIVTSLVTYTTKEPDLEDVAIDVIKEKYSKFLLEYACQIKIIQINQVIW